MKILITGTHFTPALAVIEELQKQSSINLVYIGRASTMEGDNTKSIESQIFKGTGVKFLPLISGRLQRTFTAYTIPSILKIPVGFIQSMYYLFREKPDVVLSFGGYVALPVVICAWLLSIPIIIHEQTLVSGLANNISELFADKIAISFPQNKSSQKRNMVLTGNPIRSGIVNKCVPKDTDIISFIQLSKKEKIPLVLVMGGNQGSHIINQAVGECLDELTKITCIIHQTGDSKYADFEKLSAQKLSLSYPERYLTKKWIDESSMGFLLKHAELSLARAGINTLQELAYHRVPAIVVPIPYLPKNEQKVNAEYFAKLGLVKILPQQILTKETLVKLIKNSFSELADWKKSLNRVPDFIIIDAAKRVALETILLGKTPQ